MTKTIELAKQHGIRYFFMPPGTLEMHGTDRQIEAFADAIRKAALMEAAIIAETPIYGEQDDITMEAKDRVAKIFRRMAEGE